MCLFFMIPLLAKDGSGEVGLRHATPSTLPASIWGRIIMTKNPKLDNFWRKLWDLIKPSHSRVKKIIFSIAVFELVKLSGPYLLKLIIDHLTSSGLKEIMPLIYLVILMFVSEQVSSLLGYFKDRQIFKILIDIEYYLPILAGKKLLGLSLSYHEKENTGNKISKIERGIQKISELVGNISFEVAPTFLQLIVTVIVLFIVNIWIGLSFLFFAPLAVFMTYRANKILYPLRKKRHIDYEISVGKITQSIININTVKSFAQEEREMKEYGDIRKIIKENEIKEWFRMLKFNFTRNSFIGLGRITILVLGAFLAWRGSISVGTVIFVITLSEKSYLSLFRLSRFYDRIAEGAEAVSRLVDLINEEIDIKNPSGGIIPKMAIGEVKFKNVTFRYNSGEEKALDNVSVKIPAGCVTALVGPSGGGKTTLARMIYRHYDPQAGEVLFDGINLKKYDLFAYRKLLAIVPQEVEIFNLSIAENISYANTKVDFKEIQAVARIANAEEFIKKLLKKYDTLVGERGIKLSGGQRQRVGIARAVLANPKILIFDEATSNLDSYSEKLIQEALEKVRKGRTLIIIAHRLSTIKKADKIIVLENGKIVEEGSHFELAKTTGGLYAKLLKLQEVGDIE